MPSFAGVTPNRAPSSANLRSQAAASWAPPPTQRPRTTASGGLGHAARASSAGTASRSGSAADSRSVEMSAPAQNVEPSPVSTSTRTSGWAASVSSMGGRDAHIAGVMALRFSGWRMTTVATESVTPCSSCGSMARMLSALAGAPAGRSARGVTSGRCGGLGKGNENREALMGTSTGTAKPRGGAAELSRGFGWLAVLGVILVVAGLVGLVYTGVATLTTMLLFGWLLLVGGAVGLLHAVQARHTNFFWLGVDRKSVV